MSAPKRRKFVTDDQAEAIELWGSLKKLGYAASITHGADTSGIGLLSVEWWDSGEMAEPRWLDQIDALAPPPICGFCEKSPQPIKVGLGSSFKAMWICDQCGAILGMTHFEYGDFEVATREGD